MDIEIYVKPINLNHKVVQFHAKKGGRKAGREGEREREREAYLKPLAQSIRDRYDLIWSPKG